MTQLGLPGVRRTGNYITEECLLDQYGRKAMQKYREMKDNDPVIGGMMFAVKQLLRSVDWRWEAATKDPDDQKATDFIQEEWDTLENPWSTTVDQVAEMFPFGYALAEKVFKRRKDGRVGWKDFIFLAQESHWRWEYEDDTCTAFTQLPPSDYKERTIPLKKCLHFRTTRHKNNPEGRSILRNAYTSYFYLNRLQELEAIGIERDLAGLPVLEIPIRYMRADASADEKAFYEHCKVLIRNIRRDEHEGVILPSDTDQNGNKLILLTLLSTGSRRQGGGTNEIVQRYKQAMTMTMLADFILLGHEKVGSFALSEDKTDLFAVALGAFLKDIAGVVTKDGAEELLALNGMPGKCKLVPGDFEKGDVSKIVTGMAAATTAGLLTPDPALEGYTRQLLNAPAIDEDFINEQGIKTTGGPGTVPPGGGGGKGPPAGGIPGAQPGNPAALRQRGAGDGTQPNVVPRDAGKAQPGKA
jgi:hypothetical protein